MLRGRPISLIDPISLFQVFFSNVNGILDPAPNLDFHFNDQTSSIKVEYAL